MSVSNLFRLTEPVRHRSWIGYALAVLLPFLAYGAVSPLGDIARHFPFIIFLPAVILATLLGGAGPGALAATVTLLIVDYTLIDPIGSFWPISRTGWWSFGIYAFAITINIAVIDGMIRAYRRLDATDSELREAHAALHVERQRLRAVIDQAPIGVSIARRDGGSELNERARLLLGHGLVTDDDQRYADYGAIHPDGRSYAVEDYPTIRALRQGERVEAEDMLYRVGGREKGAGLRRFAVSSSPIMDGPEIVGAVTVLVDLSEEREARDALQRLTLDLERQVMERTAELALYRDIVQSHPTPICAFDPVCRLTVFNQAHADEFYRISGHHAAPGDDFPTLFPDDQAPIVRSFMERALTGEVFTITGEFGHDDFDKPHWESRYAPLRDAEGTIIGAFHHAIDITARKRAEAELSAAQEALRQSQKMEAVGQLTGGLAHDFNNLLAVVTGSLEIIDRRMAQGRYADAERFMSAARDATKRATALTHRLLAFSRRQTLDPRPTDVNQLVRGMDELIRRTVGPSIEVETVGQGGLWASNIDPSQLENALLNLCINARDAMPDGGKLTVETANRWLDDRAAREQEVPPGQYISLCVSDSGTGMTPEVIAKAFDPFFTTKPLGQGTGLGLSMIYGFARQSGGQVRIYSELGQGSMVCIYLPRHMGDATNVDALAPTAPERAEKDDTVLVVDDEIGVRMLVVDVLKELGYTAIEAGDGPAAMKIIETDIRIDLLVTDVGLPNGMNGRQVADAARAKRPDLKVLFITGYAENAAVGNGHLDHGMAVVTKPFSVDDLANKVKGMIAGGNLQGRSS